MRIQLQDLVPQLEDDNTVSLRNQPGRIIRLLTPGFELATGLWNHLLRSRRPGLGRTRPEKGTLWNQWPEIPVNFIRTSRCFEQIYRDLLWFSFAKEQNRPTVKSGQHDETVGPWNIPWLSGGPLRKNGMQYHSVPMSGPICKAVRHDLEADQTSY